jgi:hypothetical protein
MKGTVFWDVTPYSLAKVYWHFDEWIAFIFRVKEYAKQAASRGLHQQETTTASAQSCI